MKFAFFRSLLLLLLALATHLGIGSASSVEVETIRDAEEGNARVTRDHMYDAQVTLSIEGDDGTLTPSGWSTRKEDGGDGRPFSFQPGRNLIEGWTQGVLKMKEGERALIHVPSALGYGGREMGSKNSAWYIPASSNLLFDIEILGKKGASGPSKEDL